MCILFLYTLYCSYAVNYIEKTAVCLHLVRLVPGCSLLGVGEPVVVNGGLVTYELPGGPST